MTSSHAKLRAAQSKFRDCVNSINDGVNGSEKKGTKGRDEILVPLTSSLYVRGRLTDREKVLVDVGTGFYVEKVWLRQIPAGKEGWLRLMNCSVQTPEKALAFYDDKVNGLDGNLQELEKIVQSKSSQLRVVEESRFCHCPVEHELRVVTDFFQCLDKRCLAARLRRRRQLVLLRDELWCAIDQLGYGLRKYKPELIGSFHCAVLFAVDYPLTTRLQLPIRVVNHSHFVSGRFYLQDGLLLALMVDKRLPKTPFLKEFRPRPPRVISAMLIENRLHPLE